MKRTHSLPPGEACQQIHELIDLLPPYRDPGQVPFTNGLYFFYQNGEISEHAPGGRIVRVGNHPRTQNRLRARLENHYSGSKNGSVFRKLLRGALLRRADADHPCLRPGPGKGHWEKQDEQPCPECLPMEREVTRLLRGEFWFRCVEIRDLPLRNRLEGELIATLSLCRACTPSEQWLGRYAYNENVRRSGLWNSNYVFDRSALITERDIACLASSTAVSTVSPTCHTLSPGADRDSPPAE